MVRQLSGRHYFVRPGDGCTQRETRRDETRRDETRDAPTRNTHHLLYRRRPYSTDVYRTPVGARVRIYRIRAHGHGYIAIGESSDSVPRVGFEHRRSCRAARRIARGGAQRHVEREPRRPHTTFCGTATLYLSSLITDRPRLFWSLDFTVYFYFT
jgi:hypothetical protein